MALYDALRVSPTVDFAAELLHDRGSDEIATLLEECGIGSGPELLARFHALHDANSAAYFGFMGGARWLGFRLDMMSFLLLLTASFAAVLSKHYKLDLGFNPGLVGASLMFIIQL